MVPIPVISIVVTSARLVIVSAGRVVVVFRGFEALFVVVISVS